MSNQVSYFKQDHDCHWYIVPADKVEKFSTLVEELEYDEYDGDAWDAWDTEGFDGMRVGGGIQDIPVIPLETEGCIQNVSDGYHTFKELYEHRHALWMLVLLSYKEHAFMSEEHSDGNKWDGWFISGINHPDIDQVTYHMPIWYWNILEDKIPVLEMAPPYDGHTPEDVLFRLTALVLKSDNRNSEQRDNKEGEDRR